MDDLDQLSLRLLRSDLTSTREHAEIDEELRAMLRDACVELTLRVHGNFPSAENSRARVRRILAIWGDAGAEMVDLGGVWTWGRWVAK